MQRTAEQETQKHHGGVAVDGRSKQAPTVQYKDRYSVEEREATGWRKRRQRMLEVKRR